MADVRLNPVFEAFAKQIGELVFYNSNGKTYVRRKGNPGNPKTPEQVAVRNSLTALVTDWSEIDGIMHEGWKQWAAKRKMKGNNAFVSLNFKRQRAGQPVELFKPVGNLSIKNFTVTPGSAGSLSCVFEIEGGSAGKHLHLFAKKKTAEPHNEQIVMHSAGENAQSPHVLSGLDAGSEYYIYAAVTNAEYNMATEVSPSLGVIATAGV